MKGIEMLCTGGICLLLMACVAKPEVSALSPTVPEAEEAVKAAFLQDAQENNTPMAMDMVKTDISRMHVTAVDDCEVQQDETLICNVYSDFQPEGTDEVRSNLDKIGFMKSEEQWVAMLFEP
ncbi:hypothetical protein I2492_12720 [Budviciaceae bacterium CWB-B4]|uniref:Lipoprotein n=1 Tax=Limnobaculum xujianqingii TaxID=2738837 RepID=A0A9D7FUI8_9GAMM|nr:hypothetical protein [Limnobaculum xujianqingii]MBK5073923.1 hypothetical protein [Limnobaculum xujianqingii]MBK5177183.1 hypothetical protein [Limnobaculum xujianqingii]